MSMESRTYELNLGDGEILVTVTQLGVGIGGLGQRYRVEMGGESLDVEGSWPTADVLSLLVDGLSFEAGLVADDDGWQVEVMGTHHAVAVIDPRRKALKMSESSGGGVVKTLMPGRIVRILVEEGAEVAKGDALLVVEAMKMENEMRAPRDGVVKGIRVAVDDLVEAGSVLVELK
jgi:biotin carboxyl carrier protein